MLGTTPFWRLSMRPCGPMVVPPTCAAAIPPKPILANSWGLQKHRSAANRRPNDAAPSGTGDSCNNSEPGVVDRGGSGRTSPRRKGNEMLTKEQSPRRSRNGGGSRLPPAKELVHNAMISERNNVIKQEEAAACHGMKFGDNQVSDALLARLSELGVSSGPWFVDAKQLQSTDARVNQNRLQLSSRGPISQRAFTDAEKARLRSPAGMPVAALDRRGREYEMTCRLWKNDKHYRFMGRGWKEFREVHRLTIPKVAHLTRRVTVELWAFRSRALPPPPPPEEGEDGGVDQNEIWQPDGALGLVVLLRDDDDGGEKEEAAVAEEVVATPAAESYASWFQLLMAAAALLTLRTRETKRKREDD
ncbi:unnamed protein product [Urochloa decumbens]|uniref:TF-B3 domain-containing protein n=1 Tax=Urochloa decumbens TaxID=240449 RepID=A0ABC8YW44_9POAL